MPSKDIDAGVAKGRRQGTHRGRNETVFTRVTSAELAAWRTFAEDTDQTVSRLIRRAVRQVIERKEAD